MNLRVALATLLAGVVGFAALTVRAAEGPAASAAPDLVAEKKAHPTHAFGPDGGGGAPPTPPANVFSLVHYPAPSGPAAAYVTPRQHDGGRRPAIIWVTGGDCNSIDNLWHPADPANDQTAAAYRKAGVVMMFPSMRGGNANPGRHEWFFGEVDDLIAAAEWLAKQDYVDPSRMYLGGHSTGGTLALLTAESTDRFRAVFAFGPVADVRQYGGQFIPPGLTDPIELRLRSPIYWMRSIQKPTFVIEGTDRPGNADAVELLTKYPHSPSMQVFLVKGANHFSTLAPLNALIAQKILADGARRSAISLSQQELDAPFAH
jgi:dienelactone hydrolase